MDLYLLCWPCCLVRISISLKMTKDQKYRSNIVLTILFVSGVFAFVSDDDYHKTFDIFTPVSYNCDELLKQWNPVIPKNIIDECIKQKENHAKTY